MIDSRSRHKTHEVTLARTPLWHEETQEQENLGMPTRVYSVYKVHLAVKVNVTVPEGNMQRSESGSLVCVKILNKQNNHAKLVLLGSTALQLVSLCDLRLHDKTNPLISPALRAECYSAHAGSDRSVDSMRYSKATKSTSLGEVAVQTYPNNAGVSLVY